MKSFQSTSRVDIDDLLSLITRRTMTSSSMVWPFSDFTPFLADLLRMLYEPGARLLAAGHVEPQIEMAAHRAEIELMEIIGPSPFAGTVDHILESVGSPTDIIYVANPNRVTGANYSAADLQKMAEAVPEGAVIVDEYFHEFFGITGVPLLDGCPNMIVMRSFAAPYGIRSSDSGYVLANPRMIAHIREIAPDTALTTTLRKTILTCLINDEAQAMRLKEVHEESLRIVNELTRLGVQCRITETDFILLRVKQPDAVATQLGKVKLTVDCLDQYPALAGYLRYRIQSPLSNDKLITAFKSMSPEMYRMKSIDKRTMTMRLKAHGQQEPSRPTTTPGIDTTKTASRPKRHLFEIDDEPESEKTLNESN